MVLRNRILVSTGINWVRALDSLEGLLFYIY